MVRRFGWLFLALAVLLSGCTAPKWLPRFGKQPVVSPGRSEEPAPPGTSTPPLTPGSGYPEDSLPPINDGSTLIVNLPKDDCVNLREQPSKQSKIFACLPGGTTMTATARKGNLPASVQGLSTVLAGGEDEIWVHARTASGLEGWAAVRAGKITVAPSPTTDL